jgi:hypothetical protein
VAQVVRLLGVPVDLYLTAAQHTDELVREFTLISIGERTGVTENDVPARLLELVGELRGRYAKQTGEIRSQFEAARSRGARTIDLELPGGETAAGLTERLTAMLDEADEFCRAGNLLTLAAPPDVVAWRHWWRDQVVGQVRDDAEPAPFA